MVYPIEHEGVKMISLGFVSPKSGVPGSGTDTGASVMRGPMASKVVTQLLKGTDWGEVDILILDMPPGTGDVQLTVCQDLTLSGAVCVTTPSKLAAADAEKGIDMFTSLGVPTLAAVLNMSYFECDGGGRHYPFGGNGGGDSLAESLKVAPSHIFHMPVSTAINSANEDGNPICLSTPTGANAELSAFADLARLVSHELYVLQHGGNLKSRKGGEDNFDGIRVKFDEDEEFDASNIILTADNKRKRFVVRFFSEVGATQKNVNGKDLIGRNPKTGDKLVNEVEAEGETSNHNHSNLFPAKIERKGYYGYSVEWASGATMIYSMLSICKSAGGKIV
uniref:Gamma-butyrobetaine hydroxylase-like N-terminal domain-containing protein n=1 Tax=Proboscia inermis TaxID=420281 RepID=A0A7S0C276_9STRA|mmetsp:Transcript_20421/g.20693  ORF Transcript_20421/g.20693 Transcript_20421/m.20693 type:complete len:335 (+) Transcript_20421:174-1178(+)